VPPLLLLPPQLPPLKSRLGRLLGIAMGTHRRTHLEEANNKNGAQLLRFQVSFWIACSLGPFTRYFLRNASSLRPRQKFLCGVHVHCDQIKGTDCMFFTTNSKLLFGIACSSRPVRSVFGTACLLRPSQRVFSRAPTSCSDRSCEGNSELCGLVLVL
jgi:hypothetical protein